MFSTTKSSLRPLTLGFLSATLRGRLPFVLPILVDLAVKTDAPRKEVDPPYYFT